MATFKYYSALAHNPNKNIIDEYIDSDSFRPELQHATVMTFDDKNGSVVTITGTGFEYSRGNVIDGEITSVKMENKKGELLETITGLHLSAVDTYDSLESSSSSGLVFAFNAGFDKLKGSNLADVLDGGQGNDHISGGKGSDLISGNLGTDYLTGGAGKDTFYFKDGSEHDIVTDFQDGADMIEVTKGQYSRMHTMQHGDDVVLDFGWGDQLILEHTHKADITKDDFSLF